MSFVDRQELIKILAILQPELLGLLSEEDLKELVDAWTQGIDIVEFLTKNDSTAGRR